MTPPSPTAENRTQPGWGLVDDGLAELERLAGKTESEAEFFTAVCKQLVEWGLAGAAIWTTSSGKRSKVACYQPAGGKAAEFFAKQSSEVVEAALEKCAEAGSSCTLQGTVLIPWLQDGVVAGALQILLPDGVDAAATRGFGQMGLAVAELLALFSAHHDRRLLREKCEDLQRWQSLVRGLHAGFDLQKLAYTATHDGRAILGCDRVSIAVRRGTMFRVIAVSGAEFVHRRAEVVAALERLADLVAATGEPLWCAANENDLPPQLADGVANYLEASPANRVGVIPLAQDEPRAEAIATASLGVQEQPTAGPPFAVLFVEQFSAEEQSQLWPRALRLAETIRAPLRQAWQLQGVPLLGLWISWQQAAARTKWLSRGAVIALSALAIFGLLFLIPAEVKLRAQGELQPTNRHEIFAPSDSLVTEVLVDHGDKVQADQPLLQLRSVELDLELQRVAGELQTVQKQLDAARSERLLATGSDLEAKLKQRRLTADEEQFDKQRQGLEKRKELLTRQQDDLKIVSPAAGSILTWNTRDRLAQRPLRRGDLLLTVADEAGPWQVELHLPARQASRLLAAKRESVPVTFSLSTSPGTSLDATVREVSQRVNVNEQGKSYVLVIADITSKELPPRTPGAVVFGRIHVGSGSLGTAWFYEAIDAAKLWLTW